MHFSDGSMHESDLRLLVSYKTLRAAVEQGIYTPSALLRFRHRNEDRLNRVAFLLRNMGPRRRQMFTHMLREMN
jgi:hypothetical protein